MPLDPSHLLKFFENPINEKRSTELLNLLITQINKLCFDECQIDRIACTMSPKCYRRYLVNIRIINGLNIEDLPEFCYSIQKNILLRNFWGKTVIYRPFDAYLYLIDFLDVFFHGDYRKLNKFISFGNWDDLKNTIEKRIENGEEFKYYLTKNKNNIVFIFGERIHIVFINEKYAICNANKENIANLEILDGLIELYRDLYFPEFQVILKDSKYVKIILTITKDIVAKITDNYNPKNNKSDLDEYFWNLLQEDLMTVSQVCEKIKLYVNDMNENLMINLYLNLETSIYDEKMNKLPLRYKDLRILLNFVFKIYNEYYILWLK